MDTGDRVQDRRDRRKQGEVRAGPKMRAGREVYQVRWDNGAMGWIPGSLLAEAAVAHTLEDLLRQRSFGGVEDFVRNYTHRKLLAPVDDTLYSLNASRTQILPHQFKPLVRFLDSIHRRYLIADEVGLGKTIEAGIILSELKARGNLGGVLILCPNHLRDKWRSELLQRFDERFEIVSSRAAWVRRVAQAEEDGTDNLRLIVGQKTLASKKILARLEAGVPSFDLVIVDEAHHYKNTATISRKLLGELADAAQQVLLLTATPIQTESGNLRSLLRLLDERSFRSKELFDRRLETNVHLVRAERALKTASPEPDSIRQALNTARDHLDEIPGVGRILFGLHEDGRLEEIETDLEAGRADASIQTASDLSRRIRELNLLSPYITRTRKSDVAKTCTRMVESVQPALRDEERHFYGLTVDWLRTRIADLHGEHAVLFLSREIERRLASCLPALARRLLENKFDSDGLLGHPSPSVLKAAEKLRHGEDTKFRCLLDTLRRLDENDSRRKVIVFASFRATLAYLEHRLRKAGVDMEKIHGGVPMDPERPEKDERGRRVRRFLNDPQCRVLLSSNVGGEGLDLQRASVVVNYDFPWNPAVLEQRIGRVDRFGQEEDVVRIMNFVLPGTVEGHVYDRLYARLNLFEETIGDFAPVLGEIVREISTDFFRSDLTEEQRQEELRRAAWRAENKRRHVRGLLEREHEFIAYDDDFTSHLRGLDRKGQTIRPHDLMEVCEGILSEHFPESWLRPAVDSMEVMDEEDHGDVYDLHLGFQLREHLKTELRRGRSFALQRFLARIPEGGSAAVTFSGEVAERSPELLLVNSRHPFLKTLVAHASEGRFFHGLSSVVLDRDGEGESDGLLVLFEATLEFGNQLRRYLLPVFTPPGVGAVVGDGPRMLLRRVLDGGQTGSGAMAPSTLDALFREAQEAAAHHLSSLADRLESRERDRIRPREAEIKERYRRRIQSAGEREREARWRGDEDRATRVAKYARRLERELETRVKEITQLPPIEEEIRGVAASWVEFQ